MAMRMVLQAMVAATGTTAAVPQRRSLGVGQTGDQEVVEMVNHPENDTARRMGSSSAGGSRDPIGYGGEHSRGGWIDEWRRTQKGEFQEHRKGLVGFPIPVGAKIPMAGKFIRPRRTEERRELNAGSDGGSGEPDTEGESPTAQGGGNNGKRRRGSLEMVIRKQWNAKQWKARSQAFCTKFLSRNTALSRNSKRRQMGRLLKQLKSEPLLPVNQDELTVLASMLDESKMAAADQYLHEIKLMQVELGGPWGHQHGKTAGVVQEGPESS